MRNLFILALVVFAISGCKKEDPTPPNANQPGTNQPSDNTCEDFDALNYGETGDCEYPTTATIKFVKLISYPNVNSNGEAWPTQQLFIRIEDPNDNILHQTNGYTSSIDLPLTWSTPDINISLSGSSTHWLKLYGSESGFMGLSSVNFSYYTHNGIENNPYPYHINESYAGYEFQLSVEWN